MVDFVEAKQYRFDSFLFGSKSVIKNPREDLLLLFRNEAILSFSSSQSAKSETLSLSEEKERLFYRCFSILLPIILNKRLFLEIFWKKENYRTSKIGWRFLWLYSQRENEFFKSLERTRNKKYRNGKCMFCSIASSGEY